MSNVEKIELDANQSVTWNVMIRRLGIASVATGYKNRLQWKNE